MFKAMASRMREEEGFTLIELMVVVMILAILIVMGLPTYLGVKSRFQDRAAQSDLRNTVLSARILFTDNATFSSATSAATGLVTIVPNMCYVATATASVATGSPVCVSGTGGGSISVGSTAAQFSAARMSSSTSCFVILDATTGTKYGKTTAANCYADWVTPVTVTAGTPAAAGW
jgi:prepilin-type N-terminal cleavage/methylation domain-containing protein